MPKTLKLIQNYQPVIFHNDVYLFDMSGELISARSKNGFSTRNLYTLLDETNAGFVKENLVFCGMHPILLVDSALGPIFVDCSLSSFYRLIIVTVPHFNNFDVIRIYKYKLSHRVKASSVMSEMIENCPNGELTDEQIEFADKLLSINRSQLYHRTHGKTNAEIALMMIEIARDVSLFYGCELEVNTLGLREYDFSSPPSPEAFKFAMTELCLLARNFSAERKARVDIVFDGLGVYFEFGFKLASDYTNVELSKTAPELIHFVRTADMRLFDYYYEQDEIAFAICGFPINKLPDSSDLKEGRKEFIYD